MPMPAAVLWDMDGTLVDTEPYWIAAEHAIVEEAGGTWTEELAHQLVGNDLLVSARFIRDHSPVTWEPQRIVEELLVRVIAQVRERVPWRPGAVELLADLRDADMPTALVTMSWRSLVDAVVAALPAASFTVIVTGDEVRNGKPHPEPYLRAAELLAVPIEDCLALEDSATGVRSAVAAGAATIAIPHFVPVPEIAGAVPIRSLAGLGLADLPGLAAAARHTRR